MTDTTHGLPESVLERAAGVSWKSRGAGAEFYRPEWRREDADAIRAALPILTPAIETALLERMIADFAGPETERMLDLVGIDVWTGTEAIDFLRTYLPTATESEAEHE